MSESSQLPLLDALRRVTVRPRERREMAPFKALPRAPRSGIPGRGRGVVGVGRRGGRPLAGTAGVGRGGVAVPAAGCATSPGDRAWHCPRPARNRGRSAPPMLRAPPQAPPCLRAAFEHDSPAAGAVPAPASGRRASPPHHRTADDQDFDRTLGSGVGRESFLEHQATGRPGDRVAVPLWRAKKRANYERRRSNSRLRIRASSVG